MEVKCLHNHGSLTHSDKQLLYTLIISTVLQYNVAFEHCKIETWLLVNTVFIEQFVFRVDNFVKVG